MPTSMKLVAAALALATGVAACSDARATDATQDELKRDLELASSTINLATPKVDQALLSAMETKPQGAPENAPVVKKAPGPRAVRSRTPTVRATPEVEVASAEEIEEVTETLAEAPAPEEILEPVAVAPRPQPVVVQTGGTGDYGSGGGGIYGGGIGGGVIIRGGGVDGDNCELHRRGRTGTRGPIFIPTSAPQTGGVIVNRPRTGSSIGIGSRSLPSRGSVSRGTQTRGSTVATSRGSGGTARGSLSPRGR